MALSLHELESQAADCLPAREVLTVLGSSRAVQPPPDACVPGDLLPDDYKPGDALPDQCAGLEVSGEVPAEDVAEGATDALTGGSGGGPLESLAGGPLGALSGLVGGL